MEPNNNVERGINRDLGQQRFRLSEWRVDALQNTISRGGQPTELEDRFMRLLVYLAERETVSRSDLIKTFWSHLGKEGGENALNQAISELRNKLHDDKDNPRYIKTNPKKGYTLLTPVQLDEEFATPEQRALIEGTSDESTPNEVPTPLEEPKQTIGLSQAAPTDSDTIANAVRPSKDKGTDSSGFVDAFGDTPPSTRWRFAPRSVVLIVIVGTIVGGLALSAKIFWKSPAISDAMTADKQGRARAVNEGVLLPNTDNSCSFLYDEFFRDGGYVVLSNPPVYKYVNEGEKPFLDSNDARRSIIIERPERNLIRSKVQYTGMGEAIGAQNLQRYFASRAISLNIAQTGDSRYLTGHRIILGGWFSNSESVKYFDLMKEVIPFYPSEGRVMRIDATRKIEQVYVSPEYKYVNEELVPVTEYAIVVKVREPINKRTVIIAAGMNSQGTEAAGWLVSTRCALLHSWLVDSFGPKIPDFFEVLVRVPVAPDTGRPGENLTPIERIRITPTNPN